MASTSLHQLLEKGDSVNNKLTDKERYSIDEEFYRKRYRDPSEPEASGMEDDWSFPYFTEETERELHLLDIYPGLDQFPLIAQEISWLDYQYQWTHAEIAEKLDVTIEEIQYWLARRNSECQRVAREIIECGEDDIPF